MKKKIVFVTLFVFVSIYIGYVYFGSKKSNYIFDVVTQRDLVSTVSESGQVVSNGGAFIYSSTTGIIDKIFVKNGDTVTEKQKLFSVKSTATTQERSENYALYQAAKTAVQQAENNRRNTSTIVNRIHDDLKNKDTTENFLEKETRTTAEVSNDNAYDALISAQANLISASTKYFSLLNHTATAPISGVVTNLAVTTGSQVLANSPLTPSFPVLFIKGYSPVEILVTVGENDINKIKVGQLVNVQFDAIENQTYKGIVERFDENGTLTQGVPKFNLYVSIIDSDQKIKSGMTADVDITTSELTGVLTVPNAAVKPFQKGHAVRILDEKGKLIYLPVKTGIKGKEYTQITEGLILGQKIIVSLTSEQASKASLFKL